MDAKDAGFRKIPGYGKYGSAVKVYPETADFSNQKKAPQLVYRFLAKKAGDYVVELLAAPTNPAVNRGRIRLDVSAGAENKNDTTGSNGRNTGSDSLTAEAVFVEENFRAGHTKDEKWCKGVLDQIHTASVTLHFAEGINQITITAREPQAVLERIWIYPKEYRMPVSYLGPELSVMTEK